MKNKLFILLLTIPFVGFGQGWTNTFNYGGEKGTRGYSIKQTTNGDYILGGCWDDNNGGHGILLKINTDGTLQWDQLFGMGNNHESFKSVEETNDGGYILCGVKNDPVTDWDVWLVKTDGNGNQQWDQNIDLNNTHDGGRSVQQTNDGGYIITGYSNSNIWLIKTDGNGNQLWNQILDSTTTNEHYGGYSVEQTSDGGYIITGISGPGYTCLIKTDGSGNQQWNQTFGNISEEPGRSVQQTNDGGYILTGETENQDIWLIKTDGNGNQQWDQTFGGIDTDLGNSVQQTSDGGYIITGMMFDDSLFCLIKTDGSGNQEWNKNYGCCEGFSVQQTNDGGYILSGEKNNYIHVIKTDGNGNVTSTIEIPLPDPNRKLEKVVDMLGRETKPQPNTPFIEIYEDGSTEKKTVVE